MQNLNPSQETEALLHEMVQHLESIDEKMNIQLGVEGYKGTIPSIGGGGGGTTTNNITNNTTHQTHVFSDKQLNEYINKHLQDPDDPVGLADVITKQVSKVGKDAVAPASPSGSPSGDTMNFSLNSIGAAAKKGSKMVDAASSSKGAVGEAGAAAEGAEGAGGFAAAAGEAAGALAIAEAARQAAKSMMGTPSVNDNLSALNKITMDSQSPLDMGKILYAGLAMSPAGLGAGLAMKALGAVGLGVK